jgi:hypothetical protein
MSVLVTGVPTRKRAKRKLKTREEDPRGATYSAVGIRIMTDIKKRQACLRACIRVLMYFQLVVRF